MQILFKPILILIALTLFAISAEVSIITPKKETLSIGLSATGVVVPKNKMLISVKSTGVVHFLVSNNAEVSKGQLIAQIGDEPRDKKLELLHNKLISQENQVKIEKQKLSTTNDKLKMGVGSKNSYLSEKIALSQAKERYEATKNEYNILFLEEENAKIVAPTSGTLTNLNPNNTYVSYGTAIATILDENNVVKLFVDASYIGDVKKGLSVSLQSSYKNCEATLISILPISSNNLIEVIAEPKEKLPLNLQLNAEIILKQSTGLLIPKEAIVLVNNHPAVYVLDEKNIAHLTFVSIEKDMQTKALIKETLPKNAKVVLKNAYMLHDNMEVSIK